MAAVLGPRPAAVARELTKLFEEVRRGDLASLAAHYAAGAARGEVVVVIGPPPGRSGAAEPAMLRSRADGGAGEHEPARCRRSGGGHDRRAAPRCLRPRSGIGRKARVSGRPSGERQRSGWDPERRQSLAARPRAEGLAILALDPHRLSHPGPQSEKPALGEIDIVARRGRVDRLHRGQDPGRLGPRSRSAGRAASAGASRAQPPPSWRPARNLPATRPASTSILIVPWRWPRHIINAWRIDA